MMLRELRVRRTIIYGWLRGHYLGSLCLQRPDFLLKGSNAGLGRSRLIPHASL